MNEEAIIIFKLITLYSAIRELSPKPMLIIVDFISKAYHHKYKKKPIWASS